MTKKKKKYKFLGDSEKNFLQLYQEIDVLKSSPEVQTTINDFIDWIQTIWTPQYRAKHNLGIVTTEQTYQNHLDVIQELEEAIPNLKNYHLLLNLFGDITDQTYNKIIETIDELKKRTDLAKTYIEKYHPNPKVLVDYSSDMDYGKPMTDLHIYLENKILERGYFINRETNTVHPTIGELFKGNQFSDVFESDRTRKERIIELRDEARSNFFKYTPPEKK